MLTKKSALSHVVAIVGTVGIIALYAVTRTDMHGLLLSSNLESISLSLALVMTVLMISGLLLRYTSSRNAKMFNRLLHGQFGLVILMVGLILLHVLTADDYISN